MLEFDVYAMIPSPVSSLTLSPLGEQHRLQLLHGLLSQKRLLPQIKETRNIGSTSL